MDLETIRNSPAYAPVGIILCAFAWFAVKRIVNVIPCVDGPQLRRTLLALMFSGAYFYTWAQGTNPHDAELKDNTLIDEIFLLLAGGYYLVHLYPQKYPSTTVQHFLSIIAIIMVIYLQNGGQAATTFGFLTEAPNVFLALRGCVAKLESGFLNKTLNIVYPLIFILAKFVALGYHTYLIVNSEGLDVIKKILIISLASFSFSFVCEMAYEAFRGEEKQGGRKRSRSKSRSRSRSRTRQRSRSRSRQCRKKR